MELVKFNSLRERDFVFKGIDIAAQTFSNQQGWRGYEKTPRPDNGLIFIVENTEFVYRAQAKICFTARRGDIIFAPKGSVYTVDFRRRGDAMGIDSYTVNFLLSDENGEEAGLDMPLGILAGDRLSRFYGRVRELESARRDVKPSELLIKSRFLALLDTVIDTMDDNSSAYYPIRRGVEALRREWKENHPVSRYSELCSMSETGFRTYFKRWAGMSPVQYRSRMRISAAKAILTDNSAPKVTVSRVAAMTGFDDPFYFSRVFKSITGVSPQKYEKE